MRICNLSEQRTALNSARKMFPNMEEPTLSLSTESKLKSSPKLLGRQITKINSRTVPDSYPPQTRIGEFLLHRCGRKPMKKTNTFHDLKASYP
ncbi:hypothetical protein CEXT_12521 [Caerostris extrusa]|uniref:Uncharacterized protein n=1 Tax=Caerostris extrusa TaxID=172846 RepID=A0AAV4P8X0_CAEEX|nr:hypothetical protein CEXT_12521 [Caerostris extrusa]